MRREPISILILTITALSVLALPAVAAEWGDLTGRFVYVGVRPQLARWANRSRPSAA